MPPDVIKVDRSTRWGNPYRIERCGPFFLVVGDGANGYRFNTGRFESALDAGRHAVQFFRTALLNERGLVPFTPDDVRRELRGKDLACWCAPGVDCHADVLIEVANG